MNPRPTIPSSTYRAQGRRSLSRLTPRRSRVVLLAQTIRCQSPRLVDRERRRHEQHEQRRRGVTNELNTERPSIGTGQGSLSSYRRDAFNRLRVQQQGDRGKQCQEEFRHHPVVPEQTPARAQ